MEGTCKLCDCFSELSNSHVIPEFFYEKIYDKNPRKYWYLSLADKEQTKKKEQKGLREYLFCPACETKLSKYETYACEIIYAKNRRSPVIKKISKATNFLVVHIFEGFDYDKFKLFLLSILFRLSISKEKFVGVRINSKNTAELKKALNEENALNEDEYPCLVQLLLQTDNTPFNGTILGPFKTDLNGNQVISILLDGFYFSFFLGSIKIPDKDHGYFLSKNGQMAIVQRYISEDQTLMDAISMIMTNFGALYK